MCIRDSGGEEGVDLGVRVGAHIVQERRELEISSLAGLAIREMLRGRRIERFSAAVGKVTLDEMVVVEVVGTSNHDFAPRSARSFRAARNRWTRTVDSLSPVIALTSRGVQSP